MKTKKVVALALALVFAFALCACSPKNIDEKVENLQDLKGKVVCNIGKSSPPDLTFRYILKANNIEYEQSDTPIANKVALAYASNGQAAGALLESGKVNYIIAAEPSVSLLMSTISSSKQLFDLQALYNSATNGDKSFPQSCLVVKTKFLKENPDAVSAVCQVLTSSVSWAENNIDTAIAALKTANSKTMNMLSPSSAKRSSVVFNDAFQNKAFIENYFSNVNGVVVGDEVPVLAPPETFYAKNYINDATSSDVAFKIFAPDGSPCLALAKLIADGKSSCVKNAQFKIVEPSTLGGFLAKEADMAIMPITAAATLSKKVPIQIIAITTLGSLFMLTK